jgi:hypothetical protein
MGQMGNSWANQKMGHTGLGSLAEYINNTYGSGQLYNPDGTLKGFTAAEGQQGETPPMMPDNMNLDQFQQHGIGKLHKIIGMITNSSVA